MQEWPGWKLLILSLGAFVCLGVGSWISGIALYWTGLKHTGTMASGVLAFLSLIAVWVVAAIRFPLLEDWEEEIVEQLTIHQNIWIFRGSLLVGIAIFWGLGIWWSLTAAFHAGVVASGSLVFLYLSDLVIEAVHDWDNVWDTIFSEPEHALYMVGCSVLVLLLATGLSLALTGSITIPAPVAGQPPQETYWQKAWKYGQNGWDQVKKWWEKKPGSWWSATSVLYSLPFHDPFSTFRRVNFLAPKASKLGCF